MAVRWLSTPLAVLLALTCATAQARAPIIVVDPGHGGAQEGAAGPGFLEKELALELSKKLRKQLQERLGATVLLTRERDASVSLADRVAQANRARPDLFISVHANSMPTRRQRERMEGVETFFLSAHASGEDAKRTAARENAELPGASRGPSGDVLSFILADLQRAEAHGDSSRLAYQVHEKLVAATSAKDMGVHQAPFYVLMGVEAPAILVEVGFISHPEEGRRLGDARYQDRLASAISEGVQAFLSQVQSREARAAQARSSGSATAGRVARP